MTERKSSHRRGDETVGQMLEHVRNNLREIIHLEQECRAAGVDPGDNRQAKSAYLADLRYYGSLPSSMSYREALEMRHTRNG